MESLKSKDSNKIEANASSHKLEMKEKTKNINELLPDLFLQ